MEKIKSIRQDIMKLLLDNFHHTVLHSELQELADELIAIIEERDKLIFKEAYEKGIKGLK